MQHSHSTTGQEQSSTTGQKSSIYRKIKSTLRRLTPQPVYNLYSVFRARRIQARYKSLSCADAFDRIYATGFWGTGASGSTPHSGFGSRGRCALEYGELLEGLLRGFRTATVADLGCGDFSVGRVIAGMAADYVGVDIAESVIAHNARAYAGDRVRFVRADLTRDSLPPADVALVRQVLQHLSNAEIQAALRNIVSTYPIVYVSDEIYTGPKCLPNLDMTHGPSTRVHFRSGVFIDQPPFNLPAKFVSDIYWGSTSVLRTWEVRAPGREMK